MEAVLGGFVIELTTRFGTRCTVMVPAELRQLFASASSDTPLGPSAHACTKYVPGRVSEKRESAASGLALAPGSSAGTACPPLRFFFAPLLVFTRKKLVVDAGAGSVPWFCTVGASVKAALGRTLLG